MARTPLIAAALLLSILVLAPLVGAVQGQEVDLRVERVIEPSYGGLTFVRDVITGHGGASFRYGVPEEMDEKLVSMEIAGGEIERVGEAFTGVVLYKVNPTSDAVRINAIYQGLLSYIGGDDYGLELSPAPFIDERVIEADILVKKNGDIQYPSGQGGWRLVEEGLVKGNVTVRGQEPPGKELIRFTSTSFAIVRVDRQELTYMPLDGKIRIGLTVTNLVGRRLESLRIHLPEGSRLIKVYDSMGSLGRSYEEERGLLTVNLGASRYALEESWRYSFLVDAEVPPSSGIQEVSDNEVRIVTFRVINATMGRLDARVVLPPGYRAESLGEDVEELYEDVAGRLVVRLDLGDEDPYRTGEARLTIRREAGQAGVGGVLIISGLIAMTAGVVSYRLISRRGLEAELTEKQRLPISSILKEIERLRVLVDDLDKLTAARGGRAPLTVVQEKAQAIKRTRDRIREGLSKVEARPHWLEAKMRDIESSIDELHDACVVVTRNYADLLSGKISRSAYERLYERFGKDARRSLARVISSAESLREHL